MKNSVHMKKSPGGGMHDDLNCFPDYMHNSLTVVFLQWNIPADYLCKSIQVNNRLFAEETKQNP